MLQLYLRRAKKYGLSSNAILSGITCLAFFTSLPRRDSSRNSSSNSSPSSSCFLARLRILDYVFLYLLVDYKLDDPNSPSLVKRELLLDILEGKHSAHPLLSKLYSRLASSHSKRELFSSVTLTTATSFITQYESNEVASELFASCVNKGGQAVLVGYKLIYDESCSAEISDEQLLLLGACIQLLDDLIDCSQDKRDGIATIATYCLREYEYLDSLLLLLGAFILELDDVLQKQRDALLWLARRAVSRSKHYSPQLRQALDLPRYKSR